VVPALNLSRFKKIASSEGQRVYLFKNIIKAAAPRFIPLLLLSSPARRTNRELHNSSEQAEERVLPFLFAPRMHF